MQISTTFPPALTVTAPIPPRTRPAPGPEAPSVVPPPRKGDDPGGTGGAKPDRAAHLLGRLTRLHPPPSDHRGGRVDRVG